MNKKPYEAAQAELFRIPTENILLLSMLSITGKKTSDDDDGSDAEKNNWSTPYVNV